MEPWPSLIVMLRAHTGLLSSTSIFSLQYFFPRFPKVHSDADGGPLKLPQLLVSMLSMLTFASLFGQQYALICSILVLSNKQRLNTWVWMCTLLACDSDPLIDVKSCAAALRPLCFHPKLPAKLDFVPYALALKFMHANKSPKKKRFPVLLAMAHAKLMLSRLGFVATNCG